MAQKAQIRVLVDLKRDYNGYIFAVIDQIAARSPLMVPLGMVNVPKQRMKTKSINLNLCHTQFAQVQQKIDRHGS